MFAEACSISRLPAVSCQVYGRLQHLPYNMLPA